MCPMAMTYSVIPSLRTTPVIGDEWIPRVLSTEYDSRDIPVAGKRGRHHRHVYDRETGRQEIVYSCINIQESLCLARDDLNRAFLALKLSLADAIARRDCSSTAMFRESLLGSVLYVGRHNVSVCRCVTWVPVKAKGTATSGREDVEPPERRGHHVRSRVRTRVALL